MAEKYLCSSGIERKRLKAQILTYIDTSTTDARGEIFGVSCKVNRFCYIADDFDEYMESLYRGLRSSVSGTETMSLNMRTGEYLNESEFDLD